jgi:hypothetical protein
VDLVAHRFSQRRVDGTLALYQALSAKRRSDDQYPKVAAAAGGTGMPHMSRALVFDGQMLGSESLNQSVLNPLRSIHAPALAKAVRRRKPAFARPSCLR